MALSRGRADSRGQIFEIFSWLQKEPSIRLLASYEAVSTNIKVKELGSRLIKVINGKLLDKNKQFITTKLYKSVNDKTKKLHLQYKKTVRSVPCVSPPSGSPLSQVCEVR